MGSNLWIGVLIFALGFIAIILSGFFEKVKKRLIWAGLAGILVGAIFIGLATGMI